MERSLTSLVSYCLLAGVLSGCSREGAGKGQIHSASSASASSVGRSQVTAPAPAKPAAVPASDPPGEPAPVPPNAAPVVNEPVPEALDEAGAERTAPTPDVSTQRDQPLNAAPLGLEIGYANLAGVRSRLPALESAGTNEYSRGPMFRADGAGLDVTGLKNVLLIFTPDERLQAVLMTFPKDPKGALPLLRQKYRVVENHIDGFLNRGTARLEKGDSWIEIDAPHLSFEMEIRYLSKAFQAEYEKRRAEREQNERRRKADQL